MNRRSGEPERGLAPEHETPLDAGGDICDPHHHLWQRPDMTYLLDDFLADIAPTAVRSSVYVEGHSHYRLDTSAAFAPVGETAWVTAAASSRGWRAGAGLVGGVVAFADLTLGPAVADVIAAHDDAGQGRLRGIRHSGAHDPSPAVKNARDAPRADLLADPSFRAGIAAVARAGLVFDAWLYHPQLPQLVDLARVAEDLVIVVDHGGGPLATAPYTDQALVGAHWRDSMGRLARLPNVVLKIGGFGMPIHGDDWRRERTPLSSRVADRWGDQVRWCIELFGADRVMFESNSPVDRRSLGYTTIWNAFIRMTKSATVPERRALFHDTAARVYRVG